MSVNPSWWTMWRRETQRNEEEKIGKEKGNILVLSSLIFFNPFLFCDVIS